MLNIILHQDIPKDNHGVTSKMQKIVERKTSIGPATDVLDHNLLEHNVSMLPLVCPPEWVILMKIDKSLWQEMIGMIINSIYIAMINIH